MTVGFGFVTVGVPRASDVLVGRLIAWFFGVDAEGQSLENVAKPLSARETASSSRFQGARPRLPGTDAQGRRITPVRTPDQQEQNPEEPSA